MTEQDMLELEEQINGLWPAFFGGTSKSRGRDRQTWSSVMLAKLKPFSMRECAVALEEVLTTGRGLLNEATFVAILWKRRQVRFDPARWTTLDEHEVRTQIELHRRRMGDGTYVRLVEAGKLSGVPTEDQAEAWAIRQTGKNPTQDERYAAVRMLNKHVAEANGRMMDRGSNVRFRVYE